MNLNWVAQELHAPMFIQFSVRTSTLHFHIRYPFITFKQKKKNIASWLHQFYWQVLFSSKISCWCMEPGHLVLHYLVPTAPSSLYLSSSHHCTPLVFLFFSCLLKAWNTHGLFFQKRMMIFFFLSPWFLVIWRLSITQGALVSKKESSEWNESARFLIFCSNKMVASFDGLKLSLCLVLETLFF